MCGYYSPGMDRLPDEKPELPRYIVTDDPAPSVRLEHNGNVIDLTDSLIKHVTELSGDGAFLTLVMRAEIEWDFPVNQVAVATDAMEGLTAAELTAALANGGFDQEPGAVILAHLRNRGAVRGG